MFEEITLDLPRPSDEDETTFALPVVLYIYLIFFFLLGDSAGSLGSGCVVTCKHY